MVAEHTEGPNLPNLPRDVLTAYVAPRLARPQREDLRSVHSALTDSMSALRVTSALGTRTRLDSTQASVGLVTQKLQKLVAGGWRPLVDVGEVRVPIPVDPGDYGSSDEESQTEAPQGWTGDVGVYLRLSRTWGFLWDGIPTEQARKWLLRNFLNQKPSLLRVASKNPVAVESGDEVPGRAQSTTILRPETGAAFVPVVLMLPGARYGMPGVAIRARKVYESGEIRDTFYEATEPVRWYLFVLSRSPEIPLGGAPVVADENGRDVSAYDDWMWLVSFDGSVGTSEQLVRARGRSDVWAEKPVMAVRMLKVDQIAATNAECVLLWRRQFAAGVGFVDDFRMAGDVLDMLPSRTLNEGVELPWLSTDPDWVAEFARHKVRPQYPYKLEGWVENVHIRGP